MKFLVLLLSLVLAPFAFSGEYLLVDFRYQGAHQVFPVEAATQIRNYSQVYHISHEQGISSRTDENYLSLRSIAIGGMPMFYQASDTPQGSLHAFRGTYEADRWLRANGDTSTTVRKGLHWFENPLWTPDERKLHHLLKSVPHIDKVRFVHRDKVVAPPDTRTPETDDEGNEIPLTAYEPTEVTIVMWPEWTLWNQGKTVKVSKIVVNKTSGRLTFHSDNPTTLGDATITLRQGTVTASGSPVSSRLTTGVASSISHGVNVTLEYSF